MKDEKGKSMILILLVILLVGIVVGVIIYTQFFSKNLNNGEHTASANVVENINNTGNVTNTNIDNSDNNYQTYTFKNEFGDNKKSIEIQAEICFRGSGYAGASSNVYYLKDATLYHLELENLTTEVLATGIESLEETPDSGLIAHVKSNHEVKIENNYIAYK